MEKKNPKRNSTTRSRKKNLPGVTEKIKECREKLNEYLEAKNIIDKQPVRETYLDEKTSLLDWFDSHPRNAVLKEDIRYTIERIAAIKSEVEISLGIIENRYIKQRDAHMEIVIVNLKLALCELDIKILELKKEYINY